MRIIYPTSSKEDREAIKESLQRRVDYIVEKHHILFSDSIMYGISDKKLCIIMLLIGYILSGFLIYLEMPLISIISACITTVIAITTGILGKVNSTREERLMQELKKFQKQRMPVAYVLWQDDKAHYKVMHIGELISPQLLEILDFSKENHITEAEYSECRNPETVCFTLGKISVNIDRKWIDNIDNLNYEINRHQSSGLYLPIIAPDSISSLIYMDDSLINFIRW